MTSHDIGQFSTAKFTHLSLAPSRGDSKGDGLAKCVHYPHVHASRCMAATACLENLQLSNMHAHHASLCVSCKCWLVRQEAAKPEKKQVVASAACPCVTEVLEQCKPMKLSCTQMNTGGTSFFSIDSIDRLNQLHPTKFRKIYNAWRTH
jgi:hypothetical protein